MGLRDQLNDNPRIVTGLTVGVMAVVLALLLWPGRDGGSRVDSAKGAKLFFTIDDGVSWFPDDADKVPPFQKDGRDAVRAVVFQCPGGQPFLGYVSRFTPDGKRVMEEAQKKGGRAANDPTLMEMMEVKAPKSKDWVRINDPKAQAVLQVKCPGGGGDAREVTP